MNILEHEIEDVIWDALGNESYDELQERGLPMGRKFTYARQFNLGSYGIADIIGVCAHPSSIRRGEKRRTIEFQIFELKKDEINADTFFQAIRYAKGLLHKISFEGIKYDPYFSFHLIGKDLSLNHALIYLPDLIGEVNLYTFRISLYDGITFHKHGNYILNNPSFSKKGEELTDLLRHNVKKHRQVEQERIAAIIWSIQNESRENMPF